MSLLNSFNRPPTGEKIEDMDNWKYNKDAVNRPWVKGYKPKTGAPEYLNGKMLDPQEKKKLEVLRAEKAKREREEAKHGRKAQKRGASPDPLDLTAADQARWASSVTQKAESKESATVVLPAIDGATAAEVQKTPEELEREAREAFRAKRRFKNELNWRNGTRAGVTVIPQMNIPTIDVDDPMWVLRWNNLQTKLNIQERKMANIPTTLAKPVTTDVLQGSSGGADFPPRQQLKTKGKPYITRPVPFNTVHTRDGDALFTSESRSSYVWFQKKKSKRDRRHKRPYDQLYQNRENCIKLSGCLREPVRTMG